MPGAVAQLGARLNGIEEVRGSNPLGSTRKAPHKGGFGLRKARVLGIVEDR